MKLLTVAAVFAFVALAVSKTHFSQYRGGQQYQDGDHVQGHAYDRYGQHGSNYGMSPNQDGSNERFSYGGYGQQPGQQNGEYSESSYNVQSRGYPQNKFGQNKQEYAGEDYGSARRSQFGGSFNQQDGEADYQRFSNNKHGGYRNQGSFFDSYDSGASSSPGFDSQEDYIKDEITNDIGMEIGRKVAQKMVKFFAIFDKYAARDGTVLTSQADDPFALKQWTFPFAHHEFLNMNDSKVIGLSQGFVKTMYMSTDEDSVDLEYFFDSLTTKGYMKSSTGPKGPFTLTIADTYVNVSTEMENQNRNRNYAHSHSGNFDINYPGFGDPSDSQPISENIETKYAQFMYKAIENEMIDYSYDGLVGCLRSEIGSTFNMPSNSKLNLVIENKKTQMTVTLMRTQASWSDDQVSKQRKVQSVAFRQNKSGKGYKLMVKVILAKQPTWECDVFAKKSYQEITVKNVNFHAKYIVATAVMERVQLPNGAYKFNVEDASVKFDGLKFDVGKFDLNNGANDKLAREVGYGLPKIMENGMSAALQQQLYQQQQTCQQSPTDCFSCNEQQ